MVSSPGEMGYISFKKIFAFFLLGFVIITLSWLAFLRTTNNRPEQIQGELFLGANDAQLSDKWNENKEIDVQDDGKFHCVTNVILVTHKVFGANLLYDGNRIPTDAQLEERQHEIETSLQNNLNNELVAAVHVLYYHPAIMLYLTKLRLKNSKKLILHLTRRDPTVGVNLDYIQKYLKNKYVILMHQDNFLGEGWDEIDFRRLRSDRVMYALTRYAITDEYPCRAALDASCKAGSMYLGSHDTFVFYADRDFSKEMLKALDIIPSSSGMENVLIWYFRKKLSYKVLNSCLRLKVYHNHCIPIREKDRKRYNKNRKNGLAPFTNVLW